MLPQCLDNYIMHVLQLVSLAARIGRVGHLRGGGMAIAGASVVAEVTVDILAKRRKTA